MLKYKIGDKLQIQCYKHNGKIHRAWDEAILLDVKDEYMVFGNNRTLVIEAEGNAWRTKEPAIMYFFKSSWYNIIVQLKKDGVYYYCNIATPFVLEENTIKYIDYDLDVRIFPNGEYKLLDKMEYNYHRKIMGYSKELDFCIKNSLKELLRRYENHEKIFDNEKHLEYYRKYLELKKNTKKCKV